MRVTSDEGGGEGGQPYVAIKLADFGLVTTYQETGLPTIKDCCGTPYHMAPEVLEKGRLYDYTVDLFSLGATIFYALCERNGNRALRDRQHETRGEMLEEREAIINHGLDLDGPGLLVRRLLNCLLSESPADRAWHHVGNLLSLCLKWELGLEVPTLADMWRQLDDLPFSQSFMDEVQSVAPFM